MGRRLAALVLLVAAEVYGQAPEIDHDALRCVSSEDFPIVDALIDPAAEIQTAKVYFRSDKYEDFYFVEMQIPAGAPTELFLGLLPIPGPETERIVYYIEAVDDTFNGTRNEENAPKVDDPCRRRPPAAYLTGEPGIVVGATKPGMAALPPGFRTLGIAGFISSTGAVSSLGGAGATVAVGAGVAAAGAATAVVLTTGNDEEETEMGSPATPSGNAPTSPAPPGPSAPGPAPNAPPPEACFMTEPVPPKIAPGGSVRFDASCSIGATLIYSWDFGSAAAPKMGRVVSTHFAAEGTYLVLLTVTDAEGRTDSVSISVFVEEPPDPPIPTPAPPPPPPTACFNATKMGCSVTFDGSCSTGASLTYSWQINDGGAFGGPLARTGQAFTEPFSGCDGESLFVTLTVNDGTATSTSSQTVTLPAAPPGPTSCFTHAVSGCDVTFDASCAAGTIVSYDWLIDDGGAFGGPLSRSGLSFTESFPGCDAETLSVTLTVNDGALSDASSQPVMLPSAVVACFTASVAGCSATLDAGCSSGSILNYSWVLDDGGAFGGPRARSGANVTENFAGCSGETIAVTLTVDSGATTDTKISNVTLAASPVTSCFTYLGKVNSCVHEWNASCSTGPITSYDWRVDTTAQLPAGTLNISNPGPNLVVDWNAMGSCSGTPSITVELTVRDGLGGSDVSTQSGFVIDQKSPETTERLATQLTSELVSGPSDGRLRGALVLGAARVDTVDNSRPFVHQWTANAGRNLIEGYLLSGGDGEVLWTFDFTNSAHFEPSSLRVERGQIAVFTDRKVVFRLAGVPGERIRFWYALSP